MTIFLIICAVCTLDAFKIEKPPDKSKFWPTGFGIDPLDPDVQWRFPEASTVAR